MYHVTVSQAVTIRWCMLACHWLFIGCWRFKFGIEMLFILWICIDVDGYDKIWQAFVIFLFSILKRLSVGRIKIELVCQQTNNFLLSDSFFSVTVRKKVENDYESLQDRLRTLPDKLSYDIMVWCHFSITDAPKLIFTSRYTNIFYALLSI